MHRTRLAPSPTGALHLGNARTFLINWLQARKAGWRILMRIEDLDGPRIKVGAARQTLEDLRWLGIDWDDGPVYQSQRMPTYRRAMERLLRDGVAYPCICTRKEVEQAASAPHSDDGAAVYPGTCRGRFATIDEARAAAGGRDPAIRFRVDDSRVIRWTDCVAGEQAFRLGDLGDFVVAKADGTPAYQLAVVVDDAEVNVTDVMRGDDLIDSTPRQLVLYESLGLTSTPAYYHLPLVIGTDGRRLAKRHGDTRIAAYRAAEVPPERILAWLARSSGIEVGDNESPAVADLIERFDLARVPKSPVVVTPEDERWLRMSS